jgi:hypothetical protein
MNIIHKIKSTICPSCKNYINNSLPNLNYVSYFCLSDPLECQTRIHISNSSDEPQIYYYLFSTEYNKNIVFFGSKFSTHNPKSKIYHSKITLFQSNYINIEPFLPNINALISKLLKLSNFS